MSINWVVTRDQFLTEEEVQRLYLALKDAKDLALQRKRFYCHIRDYYMIRLLLESGLRCFELAALRVSDFRNGSLIVRNGKGGKKRNVLLAKETQKMLSDFLKLKGKTLNEPITQENFLIISERRKPYTTRGIRRRIKFWFGRVGISEDLSVHSCRHTYISHLIDKTKDLVLARDNAGHSSLQITSIYSHNLKTNIDDLDLYSSDFRGKRK
ncbi:MAG: tyrosine-type recombinase/integrase [Bdellovibrionaceae bacterium]|nr:tyrosine-type recombinase/integrase [Pseudobdellovibrionaceae bacterium]